MKKLGQHFLKDKSVLTKIVKAIDPKTNDNLIEIGPGHGELTNLILSAPENFSGHLLLIEKDDKLATQLKDVFKKTKTVEVINGDALKILPTINENSLFAHTNWKLIGNIPYYITGFLFRTIGNLKKKPEICVFTIQYEVAKRLSAKPPSMNLLAASIQIWANTEIISVVSKDAFSPPPKVKSAVVKLTSKTIELSINDVSNYYNFLHILFKQPRKTILNNLSDGLEENKANLISKLEENNINPKNRPQNLSLNEIITLFRLVSKYFKN